MNIRTLLLAALGAASLAGVATSAAAETPWAEHHPQRVEVNQRLHSLNRRIRAERREGEFGRFEARRLHRHAHFIRFQEQRFARHHDGRLTRAEAHRLNREESRLHRHIEG